MLFICDMWLNADIITQMSGSEYLLKAITDSVGTILLDGASEAVLGRGVVLCLSQ